MIAWMLYAAAVGGLVAAAAVAAEVGLRRSGRSARAVWGLALVLSLVLPVLAPASRGRSDPPPVAVVSEVREAHPLPVQVVRPSALAPAAPQSLDRTISVGWLLASLLLLGMLAGSAGRLAVHRRRWKEITLAGERVYLSESVGPAVAGALRPRIVMPGWVLECGEAEQRLMVAHEREHIRARDPLLLTAGWIALAVTPWNPALWWQLRRLRLAVEMDCDQRVLRGGHDVRDYGRLLLRVGEMCATSAPMAAALAQPRSFLARRIHAMTRPHHSARRATVVLSALAGIGIASAAWALPAPAAPGWLPARREFTPRPLVSISVAPPVAVSRPVAKAPAAPRTDTLPIYPRQQVASGAEPVSYSDEQALLQLEGGRLVDAGTAGRASIEWVIEPDGTVRIARVLSADHPEMGEAMVRVVRGTRFHPGLRGGAPVRTRMEKEYWIGARAPIAGAAASHAYAAEAAARTSAAAEADAAGTPSLQDGLAALGGYHPELAAGSPEPVTVFFVTTATGEIQRSLVMPSAEAGGPAGELPPATFRVSGGGGDAARAHVRERPAFRGLDADAVDKVQIWEGRGLPTNVSIGWIRLKG